MAPIMLEPWGVSSLFEIESFEHSGFDDIKTIVIGHGCGIDSIMIQYAKGGRDVWVKRAGGLGGHNKDEINLRYPHEYLVGMEGHYGHYEEVPIIKSLTLYSNLERYGHFGETDGTTFRFRARGAKITGFHGNASRFVSRLGVFLEPMDHNPLHQRLEKLIQDMHSFLEQRFEHRCDLIAQDSSPEQPLKCPDMKSVLLAVWNVVMRCLGLATMLDSTEPKPGNFTVNISNVHQKADLKASLLPSEAAGCSH